MLLDWWLPGADGLTLLRRFRQAGDVTPVLFLTARDAVSDRVRGLDSGADDYLCKPFDYEELLARVRALSRRQGNADSQRVDYADVSVDLATHRVERAGHRLELTAKELALLVFFLRHADEVLSRTASTSTSGTSAMTGFRIRSNSTSWNCGKALETRGDRLIHTLRGRGYLFCANLDKRLAR